MSLRHLVIIELLYTFFLKTRHLQRLLKEEKEEEDSSLESLEHRMTISVIPFTFDFKPESIINVGLEIETVEIELLIINAQCTKMQLLYRVEVFKQSATVEPFVVIIKKG